MSKRHKRAKGTALLEAMLSVSLVSIGLMVSMRSLGSAASLHSRLEERTEVRRLTAQQIAVLCAQDSAALEGEMGGKFDPPFEKYRWTAQALAPSGDSPFTLLQFQVWTGDGDRRRAAYSTHVLIR